MTKAIAGGYYIKARKIKESDIAHAAPCTREVWDYLLRECNHKDNAGIKRGQCVRRISDIQEGLHWLVGYRKETYSKTQCEHALEYLRNRLMITTTKTTRGMVITICNYDHYNTPENYEDNKKTTRRQQEDNNNLSTINKNDKNEENESIIGENGDAVPPIKKTLEEKQKEMVVRQGEFYKSLVPFVDQYGKEMIREFFDHWSEPNKSRTKFKKEMKDTWDTSLRLITWEKNQFKFGKKEAKKQEPQSQTSTLKTL